MRHNHVHHHGLQYAVLFLILLTGSITFGKLAGEPGKQMRLAFVTALAYVIWGVFHHLHDGDLNWKVVVEYAAIAILGIVSIWLLLGYS